MFFLLFRYFRTELERNYKIISELESKIKTLQTESEKKTTQSDANSERDDNVFKSSTIMHTGGEF